MERENAQEQNYFSMCLNVTDVSDGCWGRMLVTDVDDGRWRQNVLATNLR